MRAVIRDTRIFLGLSQSELAHRASCSQRLISELESGKTGASFGKILSIFQALNIQLEAFSVKPDGKEEVAKFIQKFERDLRGITAVKKRKKKLKDFLNEQ